MELRGRGGGGTIWGALRQQQNVTVVVALLRGHHGFDSIDSGVGQMVALQAALLNC
jgi:hypothetical protein